MRALILAAALALSAGAVSAADVASAWVRQLSRDGYQEIEVSRTWLGRTRILAERGDLTREIVLNTRTGEVLRDYSRDRDGLVWLPPEFEAELDGESNSNSGSGNSGKGGGEDEEDEEDEEDNGGNSGSGSGNSGSGSGNSGSGSGNSGSGSGNSGSGSDNSGSGGGLDD